MYLNVFGHPPHSQTFYLVIPCLGSLEEVIKGWRYGSHEEVKAMVLQ
jgi:hypothetical protein